jgi:hypothetical protein
MKQFIYLSTFSAAPDSTKRQQMLFATDVAFAISEGYDFIKSSDNMTFQILDDNDLLEVNITEEVLQAAYIEQLSEQDDDEPADDEDDYCIQCHNIMLIDEIINNTLSKPENITPQQADTMYRLVQIRQMLSAIH